VKNRTYLPRFQRIAAGGLMSIVALSHAASF
jgi:hypothetical protein